MRPPHDLMRADSRISVAMCAYERGSASRWDVDVCADDACDVDVDVNAAMVCVIFGIDVVTRDVRSTAR